MQKVEEKIGDKTLAGAQTGTGFESELLSHLQEGVPGLSREQVSAGAGLIFKFLKHKLDDQDFTTLDTLVPESDELADAAPPEEPAQQIFSGINQALGGSQLVKLGNLSALATTFGKIGIGPDKLTLFVDKLLEYISQQGGDSLHQLVARALKS